MNSPSTKTLRILLKILAQPHVMTKRKLAAYVGLKDAAYVGKHINHIRATGIQVEQDQHYRYFIIPQQGFKELNYLSPLSERDKTRVKDALQQLPTAERLQLTNKIDALLDFQALGIEALRRPEVEKIENLELGIREKRRVLLVNYRSRNSNAERNRAVEAFGVETDIGMIRAYDPEKQRQAHFKLSRLDRVEVSDVPWRYESLHYSLASDCFDIVDNQQLMVDLTLNISAYNDLIERNPGARLHTRKGSKPDTYEFQGKVNHKFIGLRQFIFANWWDVTIHGPERLREVLVEEAQTMLAKFSNSQML